MEGNSLISFENICKIFEMRIKLDKDNGVKSSLDVLDNYEKYCKKIDTIYNNEFQKELKPLISPAVTLEKEKDRLRRLIRLLEDRLDKRVELEDRYYATTGKYISNLQVIVSEGELLEKKERLSLITKYLETSDEIKSISDSIDELNRLLDEEEIKKVDYEEKNKILEDDLYSSFMNFVNSNEYYKNIGEDGIAGELESIRGSLIEAKETLDITKESIGALITNGLDDDYASYIEEAEKAYYNYKNKEIILKVYKLVTCFEDDFKLICAKREKINELLSEKRELSDNLIINVDNELESFEKTVLLQCNTLDIEKEILDNINNYSSRIKFKEERLEELNESNNAVEILAILREYGLIDTYDTEDVPFEEEMLDTSIDIPVTFEDVSESIVEEVYNPYHIVNVTDYPKTLNIGLAKLKGESVREKVNRKLNPNKESMINENINIVDGNNEVSSLEQNMKVDAIPSIVPDINVGIDNNAQENVDLVSEKNNDVEINTPVWELPSDVKPISFDTPDVNSLPVWEEVKPEYVISNEIRPDEIESINIVNKPVEEANNMFWMPVSDTKLETRNFPNMNIPVNNNVNSGNDFIFPTINN